ncbi:MAG: TonB-dependent receptor [Rubricoccaceae bacterium]
MIRQLVFSLLLLASAAQAQSDFVYTGEPLRKVIEDVEARTDWRFLYRDALVARARVHMSASSTDLPSALARVLAPQGVAVDADPERRQILLASAPRASAPPPVRVTQAPEPMRRVRGRVVDAETGEPLPFATVTWDSGRRGVVCDADGAFALDLTGVAARERTELTASFAGYQPASSAPAGTSVTFRLLSPRLSSTAIVIAAPLLDTPLDSDWAAITQRAGGVGEGGGLRALEALPAVAPSALFSDGTIVRGSSPDAFEVRLDGVPIYNPRHLFGLADAFNLDALRAVALHYGVPPARSAAPPGGSLEYVTSAGSLRQAKVQAGVSSLGVRATVEGPLRPGRTSALVAGRVSTLGATPWGIGDDLVALGLGAETRTSPLPQNAEEVLDLVARVTDTSAQFGDLHIALADEGRSGRRTTATAYIGGDRTQLQALRSQRQDPENEDSPIVQVPVETRNRWGSGALGLNDQRTFGSRLTLSSHVGLSLYSARFEADDYTYRIALSNQDSATPQQPANRLDLVVDTLGYRNTLREGSWSERLDATLGAGLLTVGAEAHVYHVEYEQTRLGLIRVFETTQTEQRVDLHAAWAGALGDWLEADLGVRGNVYSADRVVRIAPRLRLTAALSPSVSASVGFGRSHQFVHRLTLGDAPAAAIWVLSAEGQPPTESDHLEGSVSASLGPASVHLAAYSKRTRNQREHVDSRTGNLLSSRALLTRPWLPDVMATSRGVEAMARLPVGPASLGVVYALARTDLQHPDLANGEPFLADWDRRHRATISADAPLGFGLTMGAAWTVASGTPNPLASLATENELLPGIQRLDLQLSLTRQLGASRVTASLSVRNALDHDNVTERDRVLLVQTRAIGRRIALRPLDTYDVGRLPTFDLVIGF